MPDELQLVHVSGGLLSPSILTDALADAPRRSEFGAPQFGWEGHEPEPPKQFAENIETAFQLACEHYDAIARDLDALSVTDLRDKWLRQLLRLLDFEPVFQRAHLRSDDGRDSFNISHLGWETDGAPPLQLVKEHLDESPGHGKRSPHDELQQYLNRSKADWGIIANGRRLRVLRDFQHVSTKSFVGFDLDAIFEARDFPAFRALYRLAHRSRFVLRDSGKPPLESLFEHSQAEGIQIGRQLQPQVRKTIEALAEGLIGPDLRPLLDDPKQARELFRELLIVIYRILFLLFAEQRRMLPPDGLYAETYSITALARIAERRISEPHRRDLWEGLKVTFKLLSQGMPDIKVFAFNGQLFDLRRTSRLMAQSCENAQLLKAVHALTHVDVEGLRQRVNYAELGVEELGSVYETLLGYSLRRAHQPTPVEGVVWPTGSVYLASLTTERQDLGAHYTRPPLVDFLLLISLDRLIKERLAAAGRDRKAQEKALLDLRVCDSACGSGAILIGATDRIALALATVRAGGEKPTEDAVQQARRDVLAHCIYGVDKDAFAVELCKVALWIHCAVPNLPLSFLDHRIQHGDSLVGWPLLNVPGIIPADAYTVPSNIQSSRDPDDQRLKNFLRTSRDANEQVLQGQGELGQVPPKPDIRVDFPAVMAEEERIPGDVARKNAAFTGYLESDAYRRFKAAADLWTASFFWSHEVGVPSPTVADYLRALNGEFNDAQVQAAAQLLEEFPAFHWPLRFPEIAARGGFDCFVGNPPWEQVKMQEQEWFAPRAPEIAELPSGPRRAAIETLRQTNPSLFRQFRMAQIAYDRQAEFMRNSGRYSSSEHEPNTYLLFTELVADALRPNGRAGIIVKTALGTDKTATVVFHRLVQRDQIEDFHDLVNGGPTGATLIFADVDAKERFVVLGVKGSIDNQTPRGFQASIMNWNVNEARNRPRQRFTMEILRTLNPKTGTLTSFRRGEEFDVALGIHRSATQAGSGLALLDFDTGGANPWGLKFATLFHSSGDQELFLRRENLEADGWELRADMILRKRRGAATASPDELNLGHAQTEGDFEEALPLYEGQLLDRYDHRAKTYAGYTGANKYGVSPGCLEPSNDEKAHPNFEIEPRYWMNSMTANARINSAVGKRAIIGFRNVGAAWRNQRSVKAAILPRYPATHAVPIFAIAEATALAFVGVMNTSCFDFLVRGHIPGANVALAWVWGQIPAPLPGTLDARVAENAARLSLTSHSVARLFNHEPHPWNPEERYRLDVETDALVAHAYGLTRAQYEIVLDSFEVLARLQIAAHGRYKFKDDCLAAYDEVA